MGCKTSMQEDTENAKLTLVGGKRNQTLHRLRAEPWTFSSEEMDRLLLNFYKGGVLSRSACWGILLKRVAYRAQNSSELRTRLEGELLMAVALGNRGEKERLSRLLHRMKQSGISGLVK